MITDLNLYLYKDYIKSIKTFAKREAIVRLCLDNHIDKDWIYLIGLEKYEKEGSIYYYLLDGLRNDFLFFRDKYMIMASIFSIHYKHQDFQTKKTNLIELHPTNFDSLDGMSTDIWSSLHITQGRTFEFKTKLLNFLDKTFYWAYKEEIEKEAEEEYKKLTEKNRINITQREYSFDFTEDLI